MVDNIHQSMKQFNRHSCENQLIILLTTLNTLYKLNTLITISESFERFERTDVKQTDPRLQKYTPCHGLHSYHVTQKLSLFNRGKEFSEGLPCR